MRISTKRISLLIISLYAGLSAAAQGPGLVIQRFFTKPSSGNESPFEFVELVTTRSIDFGTDPYTVVFCDAKDATTAGWPQGGAFSYALEIPASAGIVPAGSLIYVGGSSLEINGSGCYKLRQINTATTGGDVFGNANVNGVLGNGGNHADGLAVFNTTAANITSATVPADAVFFGAAVGNAAGKFRVPANDMYTGGIFGTGTGNGTLAPDPSGGQYVYATGTFNTITGTWEAARTWAKNSIKPSCADIPTITLSSVPPAVNTLSLAPSAPAAGTSAYIAAPAISGVLNDPTDPAATTGLVMDVKDNNIAIPAADYTLAGSSSNTTVVPNANILVTQADGQATVKIIPAGTGYATITLTLTRNTSSTTYVISYAASAAAATPSQTVFHTGYSDGSTAVALDDNYMIISDDEKNVLNVYSRSQSGLPVKTFDYSAIGLNFTDISGGIPRELDLEASARSPVSNNRIYWLGSHSNKSNPNFDLRPNRNRIFATDVAGTGAAAAFSFVGYYDGLRTALSDWGTTNNLGLAASMANGQDPKLIGGFNLEGMAFAPDNTTLYLGFRAPLEPLTNRVNALIAPVQNFEAWFGNGTAATPVLGTPILLDLGGLGIREITRLSQHMYVILAGDYGDDGLLASAVYRWNGNPADAPVLLSGFNVTGLNPEGAMPVYNGGVMATDKIELISDNGTADYYNDGTAAKDLAVSNFKKFRSDILLSGGQPLPVVFENFDAAYIGNGPARLSWNCAANVQTVAFEAERSADGIYFERIARVSAQSSNALYQYTDKVCCAESYLYRIKEITADGSTFYSAIKLVRLPSESSPVTVAYDPATQQVLLATPGSTALKSVRILSAAGQVLRSFGFGTEKETVNISDLATGMYIVEVSHAGIFTRKKIIK